MGKLLIKLENTAIVVKEILIDSIFPEICICGKWGEPICGDCKKRLKPYRTQLCPICKKLSETGKTCKSCYAKCQLTGLMVYGKHEGFLKDLIWRYKYEFILGLGKYFGEVLAREFGPELIEKDFLITFVPASYERERWRGYNQSKIVAKEVALRVDLPFAKLLTKEGKITPQVGLSRKERIANIKGKVTFCGDNEIKNMKILVVDDVFTTGATLGECAKVLRKAGAKEVWGLVISRD